MPVRKTHLDAARRAILVDLLDSGLPEDQLRVVYNPSEMKGSRLKALQITSDSKDLDAIFDALARILVEWDLLDDDDQVIPITAEVLGDLNPLALFRIQVGISRDLGNPTMVARSGSSSPPEEPSDTSPTGGSRSEPAAISPP